MTRIGSGRAVWTPVPVLLRIDDEEHRVGLGQVVERHPGVTVENSAHTGGVDEHEPRRQPRFGQLDLHQPGTVGVRTARGELPDAGPVDLVALHPAVPVDQRHDHPLPGAVGNCGDEAGGDVRVHGEQIGPVEQRVEQA
jgi:hypothetical protein